MVASFFLVVALAGPQGSGVLSPLDQPTVLVWSSGESEGVQARSSRALVRQLQVEDSRIHSQALFDCEGALAAVDLGISVVDGDVVETTVFTDIASGFEVELREVLDYPGRIDALVDLSIESLQEDAGSVRCEGRVVSELAVATYAGDGTHPKELIEARLDALGQALSGGEVPRSFAKTARCVQRLCDPPVSAHVAAECSMVQMLPLDVLPGSRAADLRAGSFGRANVLSADDTEAAAAEILRAFPESFR